MLGAQGIYRPTIKARVTQAIESPIGQTSLVRATIAPEGSDGIRVVTPLTEQGEVFTLSEAQALIAIPADSPGVLTDEQVDVLLLDRNN